MASELPNVLDSGKEVTKVNGLITHVDGKPVDAYLRGFTDERINQLRELERAKAITNKELGSVYGVGIDRGTGRMMEAINGLPSKYPEIEHIHPTLSDRLTNIEGSYWDRTGTPTKYPHFETNPTRHAEIKIADALLKGRPTGFPEGAMSEFRMDTRFLFPSGQYPDGRAPFCATCHNVLMYTPSNAGRNTRKPYDRNNEYIGPDDPRNGIQPPSAPRNGS